MNMKTILTFIAATALFVHGQDIKGNIASAGKFKIAVTDFRGAGDAQRVMAEFNSTLWDEIAGSGALTMVAKSFYPLEVPQRPQDFRPPTVTTPIRRGEQPQAVKNGPWLTDWAGPPTNSTSGRLQTRG